MDKGRWQKTGRTKWRRGVRYVGKTKEEEGRGREREEG